MIKKYKVLIAIVAFIILLEVIYIVKLNYRTLLGGISQPLALSDYAVQVIKICNTSKNHASCYDREIPKLMKYISMEDAFKVTRQVQMIDKSYTYCHVLGHNLSAKEVDKDPSKWKEVVARCPSGVCSNGCLHGGMQERFRAESLTNDQLNKYKADFASICRRKPNWNPTNLEQASCYHAIGHLMMYATRADVKKSVVLCDELLNNDEGRKYTHICYDGVFMQIFQPLEPEDFGLVKDIAPKKETVEAFCNAYTGEPKASCHSESWPLFYNEIMTPQGLFDFCNSVSPLREKDRCYNGLFYIVTAQMQLDTTKITDFCTSMNSERQGMCFANAASRLIEVDYSNIDKSVSLCAKADALGVGEKCYKELILYSTYNFHKGSQEYYKICNSLPEKWKGECLVGK